MESLFAADNGMSGYDYCHHTTTGYECYARHNGNVIGRELRIRFFIRHVVAADGHPYLEVGLDNVEEYERQPSLKMLKDLLTKKGYTEVFSLTEVWPKDHVFNEHARSDKRTVILRVNAGKRAISKVIKHFSKLISPASLRFIQEQEKIKDVLVQSILSSMGPDLQKGPGGKHYAQFKARELAKEFYEGFHYQPFVLTVGSVMHH